jgi:hypothetical protein
VGMPESVQCSPLTAAMGKNQYLRKSTKGHIEKLYQVRSQIRQIVFSLS